MSARMLVEIWFEATLAASLLALLLYLPGRRLLMARWLHLGWSVVLLKLLLPPLFSLPVLPVFSVLNLQSDIEITVHLDETEDEATIGDFMLEVPGRINGVVGENGLSNLAMIESSENVEVIHENRRSQTQFDWPRFSASELPKYLIMLWAIGLVFAFLLNLSRMVRVIQLGKILKPASASDRLILDKLSNTMQFHPRRVPELKQVGLAVSPMVVSWGFGRRPVLILPSILWQGWSESEKQAVLAHELAHIKRGDDRFAWLGLAVQIVQWHNPLAHWAVRQWKEAEEDAADALALATLGGGGQARRDLAGVILQTIEFLKSSQQTAGRELRPTMRIISNLANARALKRRIAGIGRFSMARYQSRGYGGLILSLISMLILPLGFVTLPQEVIVIHAATAADELNPKAEVDETTKTLPGMKLQNEIGQVATFHDKGNRLAGEPVLEAVGVQGFGNVSLEDRLSVMEEKLIVIEFQMRELRQIRARKLAEKKAMRLANANAISE